MELICGNCGNCGWRGCEQRDGGYYCRITDAGVILQDKCLIGKFIDKYEGNEVQNVIPNSADLANDSVVEPNPFKYQGIPFDNVRADEDGGTIWSKICGDHLGQYMGIFQPVLSMACEVNRTCQCGIFGCKNEAAWDVVFPSSKPQTKFEPEKRIFIVRSFERIGSESQQDIYGAFEEVEDAIECFNKVLSNEKEEGYFSDDEYSPFRNSDFCFLDEHHVYNNNDDDWWKCEIYSIPLNHSFA